MLKRLKIYIFSFLLLTGSLIADDAGQESLFSIGTGARSMGMGGGFISLADDVSAIYYNPAGLAFIDYQEFSLMHVDLFEGTIYDFGGYAYPHFDFGSFGIGYFRIGTDNIIRRNDYIDEGSFDYSTSQLLFSYARILQENFSYGINFKVIHQSLDTYSDYGFGADVGFLFKFHNNYSAGFILRDLYPAELKLASTTETTPLSIALGMAIQEINITEKSHVNTSIDIEKIENRSVKIHTGAEIIYDNTYALRAGYDKDNFAFGAGLKFSNFKLDYAYKLMDNINDSHRFSLSILIGPSKKQRLQKIQEDEQVRGDIIIENEKQRLFELYYKKGDDYYKNGQLDSSLVYYQRALGFDEENQEINEKIIQIEQRLKRQQPTKITPFIYTDEVETNITAYFAQAENFYNKKYYNAALDMLQLVLDINPEDEQTLELKKTVEDAVSTEISYEMGQATRAEQTGNYIEAIRAYNHILELDPSNNIASAAMSRIGSNIDVAGLLNRGIDLFNKKRYGQSKSSFIEALSIDRQNEVALEYLKKIAQIEVEPTTLEELQRDKAVWKLYLDGLRFMRDKQYEKAIETWNKVLKLYPNNINTINNIEQARLRLISKSE